MRIFLALQITFLILAIDCAEAYRRHQPTAFDGSLQISHAPLVGDSANLELSIISKIPVDAKLELKFRLPRGISATNPTQFLFDISPHHRLTATVEIQIDLAGNYPLQASIYATTGDNKKFVEHFYLYLSTSETDANIATEPFDRSEHQSLTFQAPVQFQLSESSSNEPLIIKGTFTYFNDNDDLYHPVRNAKIEIYNNSSLIGSTESDENGNYFHTIPNSILPISQLEIVARFENDILYLVDRRKSAYEINSEKISVAGGGTLTVDLTLDDRNSKRGLGHIFNSIQDAHSFLLIQTAWERDRSIEVIWPGTGNVSYYSVQEFNGEVTHETLTIAGGSDQWKAITMYHEYGHAAMTAAYGYDYDLVPQGEHYGPHMLETVSDAEFALSEGWAEFMEGAVDDRALNVTSILGESFPNLETNQWWSGRATGIGSNKDGKIVEGAVASILWDIFDTANSTDLAPGEDDDGISNRFELVWRILRFDVPKDIEEIAAAWRRRNFPQQTELDEIYKNHHTLSRPNTPPTFTFTSPGDGDLLLADRSFQVEWTASDAEGDNFTIELYYDANLNSRYANNIDRGISSIDGTTYNWKTIFVKDGKYYLYAIVEDERGGRRSIYSDGRVVIDHSPLEAPIIFSETHPEQSKWYADNSPILQLETRPELLSSRQYSVILDHSPNTEPDQTADTLVRNNRLKLSGLFDDSWWLHVRAKDSYGYWTSTSHFKIQIDSTPPEVVQNLRWIEEESLVKLEWDAVEELSGVKAYELQVGKNSTDFTEGLVATKQIDGKLTSYALSVEPNAKHYARIRAINGAGKASSDWSSSKSAFERVEYLSWDVNKDRIIDIFDLILVANYFGQNVEIVPEATAADLNADKTIDIFDLILVATHMTVEQLNSAPNYVKRLLPMFFDEPSIETSLGQNFPNPFNPETWIPFQLGKSASVKLEFYSIDGTIVRTLELGFREMGEHLVHWNGRNDWGETVSSGIYFYVLQVDLDQIYTQKMTILR